MQPTLFSQSAQQWTVSKLTFYIRKLLEENEILQDIWVQGEISNLSRPASGHIYFTLKDSSAALRCVMWKTSAVRLGVPLQDGKAVEVHGKIGVYEVPCSELCGLGHSQMRTTLQVVSEADYEKWKQEQLANK